MVVVRVDEDHLHARLLQPVAADGALEGAVHASGRLRVRGPEHHHLAVIEGVFEQVVLLGDAQAVAEPPHVRAAPLPAFPAVGVVLGIGVADEVHEAVVGAEPVPDVAPHVVGARGGEHGCRAHLAFEADDLIGHHVEGLVPSDGLVA